MHTPCRNFFSDFKAHARRGPAISARGRQIEPCKKKGPARGESEAFGSLAEAVDRESASREEVGRNLLGPLMTAAALPDKCKARSAAMQKVAPVRRPKKRLHHEDGAFGKWRQTDEGGGNAVCLWALPREEDSAQTRCRLTQDRGRRIRWASRRQWVYAADRLFPQWKGQHVSHAFHASKVSLYDPFLAPEMHSSGMGAGRWARASNKEALLEGRAGPCLKEANLPQEGRRQARREKCSRRRAGVYVGRAHRLNGRGGMADLRQPHNR
jgi:hypothetical protein